MSNRVGIVAGLALWDLFHEWILSLCLLLGFAAVIAPLLLLMGLKHGTISTLRHQLVEDPLYREIRPARTREYPVQWFDDIARRPEIDFMIPTILPASSIISVIQPFSRKIKIYDLVPTGPGDPLVLENGGRIPEGDQCVITTTAADELRVKAGDVLTVRVTRSRGGRREFGKAGLKIVAILDPRAGSLPIIYAPLPFVLDVENYKEGMAVTPRGWPGGMLRPYYSYDGILVVMPHPLKPVRESGLIINTGLTAIKKIKPATVISKLSFKLPEHLHVYDLTSSQKAVHVSSFEALKNKLRGQGAVLLPYAENLRLRIAGDGDIQILGLSLSPEESQTLGLKELPWGKLKADPSKEILRQWLLPAGTDKGQILMTEAGTVDGSIAFPMVNSGVSFSESAIVPAELAGILSTARQRKVQYDEAWGDFLLSRSGFRGFRLYMRSIDDVVPMSRELNKSGIPVIAQIESIERVRILDRGLTNIFWLVAVVGITGGTAALIASLYAAVERKKQGLSVMRLIGLTRMNIFLFPIFQGGGLMLISLLTSVAGYFTLAALINRVFSADLAMGGRICQLPLRYLFFATVAAMLVALMSSLIAAWRTTKIDPAEALRYE